MTEQKPAHDSAGQPGPVESALPSSTSSLLGVIRGTWVTAGRCPIPQLINWWAAESIYSFRKKLSMGRKVALVLVQHQVLTQYDHQEVGVSESRFITWW